MKLRAETWGEVTRTDLRNAAWVGAVPPSSRGSPDISLQTLAIACPALPCSLGPCTGGKGKVYTKECGFARDSLNCGGILLKEGKKNNFHFRTSYPAKHEVSPSCSCSQQIALSSILAPNGGIPSAALTIKLFFGLYKKPTLLSHSQRSPRAGSAVTWCSEISSQSYLTAATDQQSLAGSAP